MSSRDRSLPIFDLERELLDALGTQPARIVVEAPTGSGKSTQVPQFIADSDFADPGAIYVLQPRRLAARLLASRVAEERGEAVGGEVGYQVRFESAVSEQTRIRFVTEGILIRKLIEQPALDDVAAVVLDEFHERHFFGDISLARCLQVQCDRRPDLKLVVMSATLEAGRLTEYLGAGTRHLVSDGRMHPVTVEHHPPRERHKGALWDHAARAVHDQLKSHGVQGNVLVFMPGRYEIGKTARVLKNAPWARGFDIHELYGDLSPKWQDAAVSPGGRPRIVVATNVAETSITIEGVTLVVDSGLERRSAFDHRRGITTLHIEKISRASADQRAGRAGRTTAGTAIRLWSERDHEQRAEATPAEIRRMDLSEAILTLAGGGVERIRDFPWFEAPDPRGLEEALQRLRQLGALDEDERLTDLGREIGRLPVPPRFGRVVHEAARRGCLEEAALVTALSQARPLFPARKRQPDHLEAGDFAREDDRSDFQALVRAWRQLKDDGFRRESGERLGIHAGAAREVDRIARQLVRIASGWEREPREEDESAPGEALARVLLSGFSDRLALRRSPSTLSCAVVGQRRGEIGKDGVAAAKDAHLFVAGEMIEIEGKDVSVKLGLCTRVEEAWLREWFPDDFEERAGAVYDERTRRVEARRERRFRDLVLESRAGGEVPPEEAAALLADRVLAGELELKKWDDKVETWFARINLVAEYCPAYEFPAVDQDAKRLLLQQICEGATGYKEIKDRPVWPTLREWLPPHQSEALDRLAPERLTLSSGKSVRVHYREGEAPKISVLIQHLFGLQDAPAVTDGAVPVVVEILGPNHRPIQVTQDLAGFWTGSYPAVRAQLRGRYPKHDWPEFD